MGLGLRFGLALGFGFGLGLGVGVGRQGCGRLALQLALLHAEARRVGAAA